MKGWNISYNNGYCKLTKNTIHKYSFKDALTISKKYKYIYKATQNFFICEFSDKYSKYIMSDEDLNYIMVFLNELKVIKIISGGYTIYNSKTLYTIKEKIELI